jgi:hypothetical protein
VVSCFGGFRASRTAESEVSHEHKFKRYDLPSGGHTEQCVVCGEFLPTIVDKQHMQIETLKTALRQCWAKMGISEDRQGKFLRDFDECSQPDASGKQAGTGGEVKHE